MSILTFAIIGWISGIAAYGFTKGYFRERYSRDWEGGYNRRNEIFCWIMMILGPIGLTFILVHSVLEDRVGFCFKMIEELKLYSSGHRFI